jgi:hypothetical protein
MPQPLMYHVPVAYNATNGRDVQHTGKAHQHSQPSPFSPQEYNFALEPNNSFVASCAVDSAQHSLALEDWTGASMPSAAAEANRPVAPAPLRATAVPASLMNHTAAAPASEDPLGSAAAAAATLSNPWAWLSDVALGAGAGRGGGASSSSAVAPASTPAVAGHGGGDLYHCTSRRLFLTEAQNPQANMQYQLQQQAEALQAQLAAATQQLQMHSFALGAPSVTMVG